MVEKRNIMSFINDNVNSNVINGSNNIVLKKDHFINKEVAKSLNLKLKGFEFFLDLTNLKNLAFYDSNGKGFNPSIFGIYWSISDFTLLD